MACGRRAADTRMKRRGSVAHAKSVGRSWTVSGLTGAPQELAPHERPRSTHHRSPRSHSTTRNTQHWNHDDTTHSGLCACRGAAGPCTPSGAGVGWEPFRPMLERTLSSRGVVGKHCPCLGSPRAHRDARRRQLWTLPLLSCALRPARLCSCRRCARRVRRCCTCRTGSSTSCSHAGGTESRTPLAHGMYVCVVHEHVAQPNV